MAVNLGNINKICIYAWSLKGDLFIRVPIIEAVRRHYPVAEITVVVDPNNVDVLINHPDIDHVFPFSRKKKPFLTYLSGAVANTLNLRRQRFDLSIDLVNGGSSPRISRLVKSRVRLGFDHTPKLRKASNLLATHPRIHKNWTREISEVLRPLGIDPDSVRRGTSYYCSEEAKSFAKDFLSPHCEERLVAINLGAGTPEKCWSIENFVELAVRLKNRYSLLPAVFTNPGMEELAERFCELFSRHGKVVRLPRMPFDREAAIMELCEAVVTGDTSLMHLASGIKRPILALFLVTEPEAVAPEDCPFIACHKDDPFYNRFIDDKIETALLTADYVAAKFDQLMELVENKGTVVNEG